MENKFNKVLGIYCLIDKLTDKFDTFMYSYSDEEAKNYFLDQTATIAFDFACKGDTANYDRLFVNLKDTALIRLATFDDVKGEFINEKVYLIDYISKESIEDFIRAKFDLKNKFMDLIPNKEKKEGNN